MTVRLGCEGWAGLQPSKGQGWGGGGQVSANQGSERILLGDDHSRKSVRVTGRVEGFQRVSWGTRNLGLWLRPVKARVSGYINSGMSV